MFVDLFKQMEQFCPAESDQKKKKISTANLQLDHFSLIPRHQERRTGWGWGLGTDLGSLHDKMRTYDSPADTSSQGAAPEQKSNNRTDDLTRNANTVLLIHYQPSPTPLPQTPIQHTPTTTG